MFASISRGLLPNGPAEVSYRFHGNHCPVEPLSLTELISGEITEEDVKKDCRWKRRIELDTTSPCNEGDITDEETSER